MHILAVLDQAQQPARDRTAQFCATVDAHLATLPDDAARRRFCENAHTRWIGLYSQWALQVDLGQVETGPDKPNAWDYQQTIAALAERKARFAAAVTA